MLLLFCTLLMVVSFLHKVDAFVAMGMPLAHIPTDDVLS